MKPDRQSIFFEAGLAYGRRFGKQKLTGTNYGGGSIRPLASGVRNSSKLKVCYRGGVMRIDKNNPWQIYTDFWDWLHSHPIWIINLFPACVYYPITTEEVERY
jgi:hypothetical protein